MIIKVKNVENLIVDKKPIDNGGTSFIYEISKKYYFKLFFSKKEGNNYQDLRRHFNFYKLKMLKVLSSLENVPNYIQPIHIFKSNTSLFGYTSLKINGKSLIKLADDTTIIPLFNSINGLRSTIWQICKNRIIPCDVASRNLLFDGENLYLIDLDDSVFNFEISYETVYIETMMYVLESIKNILISELHTLKYISTELPDLESIDKYYDGSYLDDSKLLSLEKQYAKGDLDDYSLYFDTLLEIINNYRICEVSTLEEMRQAIRRKR